MWKEHAKEYLGHFQQLVTIEYLTYSFDFKNDGAKRYSQIFNLQSSIRNSVLSGLGLSKIAP